MLTRSRRIHGSVTGGWQQDLTPCRERWCYTLTPHLTSPLSCLSGVIKVCLSFWQFGLVLSALLPVPLLGKVASPGSAGGPTAGLPSMGSPSHAAPSVTHQLVGLGVSGARLRAGWAVPWLWPQARLHIPEPPFPCL